jgi:hypothetical protein
VTCKLFNVVQNYTSKNHHWAHANDSYTFEQQGRITKLSISPASSGMSTGSLLTHARLFHSLLSHRDITRCLVIHQREPAPCSAHGSWSTRPSSPCRSDTQDRFKALRLFNTHGSISLDD